MRAACWSRKEPVPAAHIPFMEKSDSRACPSPESMISLESSPPISMIDRAWGYRAMTEADCAMTSLTNAPPSASAARAPPVPVKAAKAISPTAVRARRPASTSASRSKGCPRHQV